MVPLQLPPRWQCLLQHPGEFQAMEAEKRRLPWGPWGAKALQVQAVHRGLTKCAHLRELGR